MQLAELDLYLVLTVTVLTLTSGIQNYIIKNKIYFIQLGEDFAKNIPDYI